MFLLFDWNWSGRGLASSANIIQGKCFTRRLFLWITIANCRNWNFPCNRTSKIDCRYFWDSAIWRGNVQEVDWMGSKPISFQIWLKSRENEEKRDKRKLGEERKLREERKLTQIERKFQFKRKLREEWLNVDIYPKFVVHKPSMAELNSKNSWTRPKIDSSTSTIRMINWIFAFFFRLISLCGTFHFNKYWENIKTVWRLHAKIRYRFFYKIWIRNRVWHIYETRFVWQFFSLNYVSTTFFK